MHADSAKLLASIADIVVAAIVPSRHRALPAAVLDADLRAVRREAAERQRRLARHRAYRQRWAPLTEDEVVDIVERRIRKRAISRTPAAPRKQHELVAS